MRKIAETRIGKQLPVAVKTGGKHIHTPLKIPVDGHPGRTGVPVIAVFILKSIAVATTRQEAAGFVGKGVVRRVREGAEWLIGGINAIGIHVVLGAGRAIVGRYLPLYLFIQAPSVKGRMVEVWFGPKRSQPCSSGCRKSISLEVPT